MINRTYTINHIHYKHSELLRHCENIESSDALDWEKEVWLFIREWLNNDSTVELKTSGSTGVPKRIMIKKEYLRNSAMMTLNFLGLKRGDSALLCLSAAYIAGKMMIVRALEGGLDLLLREAISNPLKGHNDKICFAAMVPLQVEKVIEEKGVEALQDIDQLIIGGAAVGDVLQAKLHPLTNAIWSTYGMTETVSHVAMKRLSGTISDSYVAMPDVSFSTDRRGCLQIDAPHLASERVVTNDVVELNAYGFTFIGRYDNIINSGGVKLVPEVIEQKIASLFQERFFISSLPDERLGSKLVLYIETQQPKKYDWFALQNNLAQILPPFERPKELICLSHFEETKTGKVKRRF